MGQDAFQDTLRLLYGLDRATIWNAGNHAAALGNRPHRAASRPFFPTACFRPLFPSTRRAGRPLKKRDARLLCDDVLVRMKKRPHGYGDAAAHFASSVASTSAFASTISVVWKAFFPASLSEEPTSQQRSLKAMWRSCNLAWRRISIWKPSALNAFNAASKPASIEFA